MITEKLQEYFGAESLWVSLSLLAIAVSIAIIFNFALRKVLIRIAASYEGEIFSTFLKELKNPLFFFILILSITGSTPYLTFDQSFVDIIQHVVTLLVIIAVAWLAINAVDVIRVIILRNYDVNVKDNLEARKVVTQYKVLEQILVVVILIIALAAALMTFERIRQLGISLLASAGIIGIIIGFAAQKSIATVVAGFQIALTQPIRLDDVVIVEGEWGRIEEITLTYVVVRIWDQRRLIVPISYFIEKPFQNWTRVSADILGTVFIYTDYKVPFDELRKELTRLLENNDLWDKKVNVLQVTNATEKTVEIRALMSAGDSATAWDLRVHVREKLIEFLQKNYPESLPRSRVELDGQKAKEG